MSLVYELSDHEPECDCRSDDSTATTVATTATATTATATPGKCTGESDLLV